MNVTATNLAGVFIVEPRLFQDERGYFYESFNEQKFQELIGSNCYFVQDNQSKSKKNVLRGMHFQEAPYAQGKLVRVIHGSIFDVAVDIQPGSPTFGQWFGVELTSDNHKQLWIPPGYAHGFLSLQDDTIVSYKTTYFWHAPSERCLLWDDPQVAIEWPTCDTPIQSAKDQIGCYLKDLVIQTAPELTRRAA